VRTATDRLGRFQPRFEAAHLRGMRAKLGLVREEPDDQALVDGLLARLATHDVDYTLFFRRLCAAAADPELGAGVTSLFGKEADALQSWAEPWRRRLTLEAGTPEARADAMRRVNPAFIPRNHRIEEAIEAAVQRDDLRPFDTLVQVLARPYEDQPEHADLEEPPGPEQRVYKTFCGT